MHLKTDSRKNITQQVNINTNQPKNYNALCGVPEGSILGPLLLFYSINASPLFIVISIRSVDIFADDTTLYDNGLDKIR